MTDQQGERGTDILSAFVKNIKTSTDKNGVHTISCRKGLWSVSCANHEDARREALHYFAQYFEDGEYD